MGLRLNEVEVTSLDEFLEVLTVLGPVEEGSGRDCVYKLAKIMMQNMQSGRLVDSGSPVFLQSNFSDKLFFPDFRRRRHRQRVSGVNPLHRSRR